LEQAEVICRKLLRQRQTDGGHVRPGTTRRSRSDRARWDC
jgi:hypothetical protein